MNVLELAFQGQQLLGLLALGILVAGLLATI